MGGWRNLRHRIESVLPEGAVLRLLSRRGSPTPATGYYHMHIEQERLLLERALAAPDPEARARTLGPKPRHRVPR